MRELLRTGGGRLQDGIAAGIAAGVFALVWHKTSAPLILSVLVGLIVLLVVCYATRRHNRAKRGPDRSGESTSEAGERVVT